MGSRALPRWRLLSDSAWLLTPLMRAAYPPSLGPNTVPARDLRNSCGAGRAHTTTRAGAVLMGRPCPWRVMSAQRLAFSCKAPKERSD
jgi:hypothetical protein